MAFRGLFIGIDRYLSPDIPWLTCAKRDAVALHALCTDTLGPGAVLLTDDQATRAAIEREFFTLTACDEDDVVFIGFSGHGTPTHELVTYDADLADRQASCIPLALLTERFSLIPAKRLVCVLDCCFSGGMGAKVLLSELQPRNLSPADEVLDQLSGHGRVILTASRATEPAWEAGRVGHGLLTYHLLQALQGADEVRRAGKISVFQLLDFVTKQVINAAAQFGKEQSPTLRGQMDGELTWPVFTPGAVYYAAFPERARPQATHEVKSLAAYGFPEAVLGAWAESIPSLNTLQLAAINDYGLLDSEHIVISAPTSSGKTMIGELAALHGVVNRKRALFLLPLKALVNDKYRYFSKVYGPLGVRTIMVTGEHAPDIPLLMRGQYDIGLLTYEKFGALLLAAPHILEQVGTIVVDEVQMVADESRGANLEFLLTLLRIRRHHGTEPQLVALSAVIGDTNGLERWLGARLLRRDERPVPLQEGLLLQNGCFRYIDPDGQEQITDPLIRPFLGKGTTQDWLIPLVRQLVAEKKQVIIFRATKGETRGCAKYLSKNLELPPASDALTELPMGDTSRASQDLRHTLTHGVAFHNADLDRDERFVIEKHFRVPGSTLRVLVATTTLAMGVNTPAEAVVIAGLEHPGPKPYSVAEYKNMVGRAGRLGLAKEGTSYLFALDFAKEQTFWRTYVQGTPEDLRSRFTDRDTDPRSLLLRVLVGAGQFRAGGISMEEAVEFLEGSFGAFLQRQVTSGWQWNEGELMEAFQSLESHRLITREHDGLYHLTALGRFAGQGGVQVESIVRLVNAFSGLPPYAINDPALITASQITVEVDDVLFPMNKRSKRKEPQKWTAELCRQKVPDGILSALERNVTEQHQGTLRAKKAVACLLWITEWQMDQIEQEVTQFGGAPDGAAGPIRSVAARTCDLLPAAAHVAEFVHPSLNLGERVTRLLTRLDVGVPSGVIPIATHAGDRLSRADYQRLIRAGLHHMDTLDAAADSHVLPCVEGNMEKLMILRGAVEEYRRQQLTAATQILPMYEP